MGTANRRLKTQKGQLFSGDIAIATVIFMAALATAFVIWNSVNDDINRAEDLRAMEKLASNSIEQLIRTPGVPEGWTYQTVKVPGLATQDRVINETKALVFIALMNATNSTNYHTNQGLMGVAPYNFYLNVTDLADKTFRINGTTPFIAGWAPQNEDEGVVMLRTAIFEDQIVRVILIIWR